MRIFVYDYYGFCLQQVVKIKIETEFVFSPTRRRYGIVNIRENDQQWDR